VESEHWQSPVNRRLVRQGFSMSKRNFHVVPSNGRWAVKPAGKPSVSTHRTQAAAENAARPLARQQQSEVVTHRRDGTIRDSDSYGRDPNPPRDTKH
jgi:hypothetical protein